MALTRPPSRRRRVVRSRAGGSTNQPTPVARAALFARALALPLSTAASGGWRRVAADALAALVKSADVARRRAAVRSRVGRVWSRLLSTRQAADRSAQWLERRRHWAAPAASRVANGGRHTSAGHRASRRAARWARHG